MSARGPVVIYVKSGDTAALRAAVSDYLSGYNDDANDHAIIHLEDVNWLNTDALIAANPTAVWYAACDTDCEDSNVLFMYADSELAASHHLRDDLVIPADEIGAQWADAAITKWNRVRTK